MLVDFIFSILMRKHTTDMTSLIERHDSDIVEGFLKQQCVDASGLFVWERKLFSLDIGHLELHIKDADGTSESQSSLSLKGVKYAKEWSFSSSVSGFGFDLVWFSGKLWSFFAEDEPMCKLWVSSINRAISIGKDPSRTSGDFELQRVAKQNSSFNTSMNSVLNDTKLEETSPPHHFTTPFSEPPTTNKFAPSETDYYSAASGAPSREGQSVQSRKVSPKRYENTEAEHEYPPYIGHSGVSVRSSLYNEPGTAHSSRNDYQSFSGASDTVHSQQYAQHTQQQHNHLSNQNGNYDSAPQPARSVASSHQQSHQHSQGLGLHASSGESQHSKQFSLHSQSLLSQGNDQDLHPADEQSHRSRNTVAHSHQGELSVRSAHTQQHSHHNAQSHGSNHPHTPSRSHDSVHDLPHCPTTASVQGSQRGGVSVASSGSGAPSQGHTHHTQHSKKSDARSEPPLPHYPSAVSVTSHDPSEHTDMRSQAHGQVNFSGSLASHSKDAHSSAHSEQHAPHVPSGASVNTLHSYEQSLLQREQSSQAHGHVNFPRSVATASHQGDGSHPELHQQTESTRPPIYPIYPSSASVISALTHDVSHHPKGLHAPSSGSRGRPGSSSDDASAQDAQEHDEQASRASARSKESHKSAHHNLKSSQQGDSSVRSGKAAAGPAHGHAKHHVEHLQTVQETDSVEHSDVDQDQESEMHHRHYARVHPHGEAHSTLPPLPPSSSRDSRSDGSHARSELARSTDFTNPPSEIGDEDSSFGGSSYASRPYSFQDHESMMSSQQPSGSASAATHNIQQRLLFGKPTPVSAAPAAPHGLSAWPGPNAGISNNNGNGASASVRGSLEELPQSVQMSARMDIQRELSAHEVAKERPSVQAFAHEALALHAKCQLLEVQLQRKESEVDVLKQRMAQQQDRFDQSTAEFEQRLDLARDKERQLISESKREMENKLLRASNDNMSFFDAANKSMRLQHERELSCLREELQEERKRHSNLLDRSQTLRERAEKAEADTQQELTTLKDKHSTLMVESARLKREHEIERNGFEAERKHLIQEAQNTITTLQSEKEQVMVEAHHQLRDKVAEMNEKMQRSLSTIKDSETEIMRQELEGQRIRSLAELHKKCQREIEIVRTEERRLAAIEMENIRTAFLSREHQTSEDLIQLEKLHSARVKQLEEQVLALKADNTACHERLKIASKEAHYGSSQVQRAATEMQERMEEHAARAEELQREVLAAHKEVQECKVREASYRDQLSRALTESRMQHAELLEARQQASTGSAQAFQWRNATRESDLSIAAADTAVRIARDEVAMLEHQLKRVEIENAELKSELQRADRLIYGVNHANTQQALSDAASLNFNTTSLSTKHLLRSSLTGSVFASPRPDLMNPTASSLAKNSKMRKALTPKR